MGAHAGAWWQSLWGSLASRALDEPAQLTTHTVIFADSNCKALYKSDRAPEQKMSLAVGGMHEASPASVAAGVAALRVTGAILDSRFGQSLQLSA